MQLTERINAHLRDLSDADKCIWRYIESNRAAACRSSIHDLARACAVSSASVVRFAQKLGFDGFSEMKAVMRMEDGSSYPRKRCQKLAQQLLRSDMAHAHAARLHACEPSHP